jgi:hypothetical protein
MTLSDPRFHCKLSLSKLLSDTICTKSASWSAGKRNSFLDFLLHDFSRHRIREIIHYDPYEREQVLFLRTIYATYNQFFFDWGSG